MMGDAFFAGAVQGVCFQGSVLTSTRGTQTRKKTGGMFEVRRWGASPFEEHLLGSVIHSKHLGGIESLLRLRISFYQPY